MLVERGRAGDRAALGELLSALRDDIYGLALRMTGHPAGAEDTAQEVLIKVMTRLDSFRDEASPRTWAYRIAVHHLLDRRKSRVEALGLGFERFGEDLLDGLTEPSEPPDPLLVEEVKLGCTLAMLTCLDREHRLAYILGEIFDLPADLAAEICDVSSEVHRQRLSRARRKLEAFTFAYCGLVTATAPCRCDRRVERAVKLGRVQRGAPVLAVDPARARRAVDEVNALHTTAAVMRSHPDYAAPERLTEVVRTLLQTNPLEILEE